MFCSNVYYLLLFVMNGVVIYQHLRDRIPYTTLNLNILSFGNPLVEGIRKILSYD